MVEAYAAWGDQQTIAATTQRLIVDAADRALGRRTVTGPGGVEIDLDGDWTWLPFYQGLSEAVGEDITVETPLHQLTRIADQHEVGYRPGASAGRLAMEIFQDLVEPGLLQPTFVHDYPALAQPLARPHRDDPRLVEAWDLIIGGVERGTGFSELIDPVIQRQRLTEQSLLAAGGDPEAMELDEDFLQALELGAPPMGGMGMGVDRLLMLFTGAGIRETILFPLLRPV